MSKRKELTLADPGDKRHLEINAIVGEKQIHEVSSKKHISRHHIIIDDVQFQFENTRTMGYTILAMYRVSSDDIAFHYSHVGLNKVGGDL